MAETWTCPVCLTDHKEPNCSTCGRNLVHDPDAMFSVRVPGVRSPAELERVRRIYGAQAASQVVLGDALVASLRRKPDEQRQMDSLWEANHFDMQRMK